MAAKANAKKSYSRAPRYAYGSKRSTVSSIPRSIPMDTLVCNVVTTPIIEVNAAGNAWLTMWSGGITQSDANNVIFIQSTDFLRYTQCFANYKVMYMEMEVSVIPFMK